MALRGLEAVGAQSKIPAYREFHRYYNQRPRCNCLRCSRHYGQIQEVLFLGRGCQSLPTPQTPIESSL